MSEDISKSCKLINGYLENLKVIEVIEDFLRYITEQGIDVDIRIRDLLYKRYVSFYRLLKF